MSKNIKVLIIFLLLLGLYEGFRSRSEKETQVLLVSNESEQYILKTSDNFETATINIELLRVKSADGILLESKDKKFSIHMKGEEALFKNNEEEKQLEVKDEKTNTNGSIWNFSIFK